jgi:tetrahydromethanopterin S-methyltransferase subunit E
MFSYFAGVPLAQPMPVPLLSLFWAQVFGSLSIKV